MIEVTIAPNEDLKQSLKAMFPMWLLGCSNIPAYSVIESDNENIQNGTYEIKDVYSIGTTIIHKMIANFLPIKEQMLQFNKAIEKNCGKKCFIYVALNYVYALKEDMVDVDDLALEDENFPFSRHSINIGENPSTKGRRDLRYKLDENFFNLLERYVNTPFTDKNGNINSEYIEDAYVAEFFYALSDILFFREVRVFNNPELVEVNKDRYLKEYLSVGEEGLSGE